MKNNPKLQCEKWPQDWGDFWGYFSFLSLGPKFLGPNFIAPLECWWAEKFDSGLSVPCLSPSIKRFPNWFRFWKSNAATFSISTNSTSSSSSPESFMVNTCLLDGLKLGCKAVWIVDVWIRRIAKTLSQLRGRFRTILRWNR